MKNNRRGSMMLIFLFTSGLLAILVTGLYYVMSVSAVQQAAEESIATKKMVERGVEQIHKSELERLVKDYISNSLSQTLVSGFDSASYQTALATAIKWGFNTSTLKEAGASNPGNITVTMPDTVSYPPLSKNNPVATNTAFSQHPLYFPLATDALINLQGSLTPTRTDKTFTYSRNFVAYREIPIASLPLSVAYNVSSLSRLGTATLSGGPVALFAGDSNHANAVVADSISSLNSSPSNYPNLPLLVSTYGVSPETISSYVASGTGAQLRQLYCLDLNTIILGFDGTTIAVIAAPTAGTTVPAAITASTYDGRTRAKIKLSTLPISGNYSGLKWYVHCTTNAAKASGVVIEDDGALGSVSIATDGMLSIWNKSGTTPTMLATSYGGVSVSNSAGYNGTTASAAISAGLYNSISAYTKSSTLSTTGSVAVSPYSTTVSNTLYSGALMGFYVTANVPNSGNLHLILTNTGSYVEGTNDKIDLNVSVSGGGTMTANFKSLQSLITYDSTSTTPSNPGASAIYGFLYAPATNEAFITINGTLVLQKKMATPPSWLPSNVVMSFGGGTTVSDLSIKQNPIGTFITSPQNGQSSGTINLYGGLATGEGIASAQASGTTLNFSYKSAVGIGLENLCERILVHYPYFYTP